MKRRFIAYHRYQKRNKLLLLIVLFIIGLFLTTMIKSIHITKESAQRLISLSTNSLSIISNIDLKSPNLLKLSSVEKTTKPKEELTMKKDPKPLIYIYNTHQTEEYDASTLKEYNITPTVYMAANILKKKLSNLNIEAIVEDENIVKVLKEHNWKYSESYNASMLWLERIHEKYPSIKYFIDLHRDSSASTVLINDKPYAKMMFVIGMNHENYEKNESLMLKLNDYLKENYEGLMREPFYGKRSRYNQHFNENVILIEVGGPKNTIEEVQNSIDAFAYSIESIIGGI